MTQEFSIDGLILQSSDDFLSQVQASGEMTVWERIRLAERCAQTAGLSFKLASGSEAGIWMDEVIRRVMERSQLLPQLCTVHIWR